MSLSPQCTGKLRYPTAPAAYRVLRRRSHRQHDGLVRRVKRRHGHVRIYRCADCRGGWHMGTDFQSGAVNWGLLLALALSLVGWWGIALLLPSIAHTLGWWR